MLAWEGNIDADVYYRILPTLSDPKPKNQGGREFLIFMQDNAPVHTARNVLYFFMEMV